MIRNQTELDTIVDQARWIAHNEEVTPVPQALSFLMGHGIPLNKAELIVKGEMKIVRDGIDEIDYERDKWVVEDGFGDVIHGKSQYNDGRKWVWIMK